MVRKFRKKVKKIIFVKKPVGNEDLHRLSANIPLNKALTDRLSFSVLKNNKNSIRKIENISYEINIDDKWEWVVRYDDHSGMGLLHRHVRVSLKNERDIQSSVGIIKYRYKNYELTWVCNDIRKNYLYYRRNFRKNCGLDLY